MEKKTNAIELWAESLSKKPIQTLTKELAEVFITFTFAEIEHSVDEEGLKKLLDEKEGGMASVFWLRVKHRHTYEISVTVAAFFGEYIKNFGVSTMLANYMQWWAYKRKITKITMREVAHMFPNGFPTEESWNEAWNEQKVECDEMNGWCSDNGLDYPQLMGSIKEIKTK